MESIKEFRKWINFDGVWDTLPQSTAPWQENVRQDPSSLEALGGEASKEVKL